MDTGEPMQSPSHGPDEVLEPPLKQSPSHGPDEFLEPSLKVHRCEIGDPGCSRRFKQEEHREQHYKSYHFGDIYTSPIQEASDRKSHVDERKNRSKRINLFFDKKYPTDDSRGNSSMRSFIDLLALDRDKVDSHPSEPGWDLPQDHVRHILNFPAEILGRILKFTLVTPRNIAPLCVRCKVDGQIREPTYFVGKSWSDEQQVFYRSIGIPNCKLGIGDLLYTRYEAVYRRPIDATVLRACKLLHEFGRRILYGNNTFTFDLADKAYLPANPLEIVPIGPQPGLHSPPKRKCMPRSNILQSEEIETIIRSLYSVRDPLHLPDWVYCDPFVHFLFSIGPTNASYIRKFKISGRLFPSSEHYHGYACTESSHVLHPFLPKVFAFNLSYFVKAYAPFISLYCANLDTFNVGIDSFIFNYSHPEDPRGQRRGLEYPLLTPIDQPQYDEFQPGDDKLDEDTVRKMRTFREEMRLKGKTELIAEIDTTVACHFKLLLEEVTRNMKNLRNLEVMRFPPYLWNSSVDLKYNQTRSRDCSWVEMDLANDAKLAIAERTRKRMQDVGGRKGEEVKEAVVTEMKTGKEVAS